MEAAFVILLNSDLYNYVRRLQTDICKLSGAKETLKIEPHITLKYAFNVKNIKTVEKYFDEIAKTTRPFKIEINGINLFPTQVFFVDVTKNQALTNFHLKVLRDLKEKFSVKPSEFEGKTFHFHITLAYKDIVEGAFQKIKKYLQNKKPKFRFTVKQLGLYLRLNSEENWFLYKISEAGHLKGD